MKVERIEFPFTKRQLFVDVRRQHYKSEAKCCACDKNLSECEGDDVGLLYTEQGKRPACETCIAKLLEGER